MADHALYDHDNPQNINAKMMAATTQSAQVMRSVSGEYFILFPLLFVQGFPEFTPYPFSNLALPCL
jgi:hypothetical protein